MPQVQRTERNIEKVQHFPGGPQGEKVYEVITVSEPPRERPDLGQRIVRLVTTAIGFGLAASVAQELWGGPHYVWLGLAWCLWICAQE